MSLEEIIQKIEDNFNNLPTSIQSIMTFILVFIIIWVMQRYVIKIIWSWLNRFTKRTTNQWDDAILLQINRPLRYISIAISLSATITLFNITGNSAALAFNLSSTLFIIAIYLIASAILAYVTNNQNIFSLLTNTQIDNQLLPFVRTGVHVILIAFALVIIMDQWGYDVNGLIAGLGIGGMAIALAAQDTIANVFGFSTIVGDRPFVTGDFIKTPDVEGVVERVGVRSTRVRQLDKALVTVPNSMLSGAPIINWSQLEQRRFNTIIGLTYDTTPDQMESFLNTIRAMLNERESVDKTSIAVYFVSFGASALEVLVRCSINLPDWSVFTEESEQINLEIMRITSECGLSMAFPSRSIYVENWKPAEMPKPSLQVPHVENPVIEHSEEIET